MKLQYFKRLVSWILVCGLVAACRSAPTRLSSLTVVPAQKTVAYAGQPIQVDAVSLPATFDRVQIIEQVGPQDYRIDDTSRRAAPLAESARQVLSRDLNARLPMGTLVFPNLPKPEGALGVRVDVLSVVSDGSGTWLEASWLITNQEAAGSPHQAWGRWQTTATLRASADTVQTWSILLGKLADAIVADLTHDALS